MSAPVVAAASRKIPVPQPTSSARCPGRRPPSRAKISLRRAARRRPDGLSQFQTISARSAICRWNSISRSRRPRPAHRNFSFRAANRLMASSSRPWLKREMLVSPYLRSWYRIGRSTILQVQARGAEQQVEVAEGVEVAEVRPVGRDLLVVRAVEDLRAAQRVADLLPEHPGEQQREHLVGDQVQEAHGPPFHGIDEARAVQELALAAGEGVDEPVQVLRRHAHVGVEDGEDVAPRLREAEAHRVALALPGLLQQAHARAPGARRSPCGSPPPCRPSSRPRRTGTPQPGASSGRRAHQRLDVAGLVAAGDDDAHRRARPRGEAMRRGPRDEPVHERQQLDAREGGRRSGSGGPTGAARRAASRSGSRAGRPRSRRAGACCALLRGAARPPPAGAASGRPSPPRAAPAARGGCSCRRTRACARGRPMRRASNAPCTSARFVTTLTMQHDVERAAQPVQQRRDRRRPPDGRGGRDRDGPGARPRSRCRRGRPPRPGDGCRAASRSPAPQPTSSTRWPAGMRARSTRARYSWK